MANDFVEEENSSKAPNARSASLGAKAGGASRVSRHRKPASPTSGLAPGLCQCGCKIFAGNDVISGPCDFSVKRAHCTDG